MVELLKEHCDPKESLALLALLMCYIKRRFNLYFRTKETDRFALGEFILYFDELVELASYSGLHIFVMSEQEGEILPFKVLYLRFLRHRFVGCRTRSFASAGYLREKRSTIHFSIPDATCFPDL